MPILDNHRNQYACSVLRLTVTYDKRSPLPSGHGGPIVFGKRLVQRS